MLRAERLCAAWENALGSSAAEGRIHSVFDRAVNIMSAGGMVSILPADKGLFPWSCTVPPQAPFPDLGLRPAMKAVIDRSGVRVPEADFAVDFSCARICSLDVWERVRGIVSGKECLPALKAILYAEGSGDGVRPLALGGADTLYSAKIRPRMEALHDAFTAMDPEAAALAAAALAGCGPGLTPSSDDMLLGYVCAFYALSHQGGQARERTLAVGRAACTAAAGKTNAISGSFLRQCGDGLASQNILELLNIIFSGSPEGRLAAPVRRILSIGATSGADILTGIVLSLQTHGRGEEIGQIGSS